MLTGYNPGAGSLETGVRVQAAYWIGTSTQVEGCHLRAGSRPLLVGLGQHRVVRCPFLFESITNIT